MASSGEIYVRLTICLIAIVVFSAAALAQDVQVNQSNRTIAVTATEQAVGDADTAVLSFGVNSYAPQREEAIQTNSRISKAVIDALLALKVDKKHIETTSFSVSESDKEEKWTSEEWQQHRFAVHQGWKVEVPAADAEKITAAIAEAGANEITSPTWKLSDPTKLQAEAGSAALEKAKRIADEMAKKLGAKLGKLVYASNTAPPSRWQKLFGSGEMNTTSSSLAATTKRRIEFRFFPEQVSETATVHAVFAIE